MNVITAIARRAQVAPGQVALVAAGRKFTYGDLMSAVLGLAAQLAVAGVRPGEVVGIATQGAVAQVLATLALAHLGATSVGLPSGAALARARDVLEQCGVVTLLHNVDPVGLPDAALRCIDLRELHKSPRPAHAPPAAAVAADGLWRISLSSGTTGTPKAVGCTWREQLLRNQLAGLAYPVVPGQATLVGLGMGMSFALHYWLRPLSLGGAVICSGLDARTILEDAHQHQPNMVVTSAGVALNMAQLAAQPGSPWAQPVPALQTLVIGGGALSPAVVAMLQRHVCPNVSLNFGSTEAGLIAVADPQLQRDDPECTGRLLPWVEARAHGPDGAALGPEEAGRLWLRSPTLASGYRGAGAAADGADFRDGWFRSADVARVRPDGRLYLQPRSDVLNRGGAKIDAARIEAVVRQDSAILDCVAVMLPGAADEGSLAIAVVTASPLDHDALARRCAAALGAVWTPAIVARVADLPRNDGGKVMRDAVVRQLQAHRQAPAGPAA